MICLTGDIHHSSLRTPEQQFVNSPEAEIALEYVKIAEENRIRVTLFITGKTFKENWKSVKKLLKFRNVEIGGHTFSGLRPRKLHILFKRMTKSYYGPSFYQKRDIGKTLEIIKRKTKREVLSWRTHAFVSDEKTCKLLARYGVKVLSDEVRKSAYFPMKIYPNLISLPINVMPDHEHIIHADRTPKAVRNLNWTDDFTSKSYYIDEWFKIIKEEIVRIEKKGGIATILAHPICMYVSDRFKVFKELCSFVSAYETIFAKDTVGSLA